MIKTHCRKTLILFLYLYQIASLMSFLLVLASNLYLQIHCLQSSPCAELIARCKRITSVKSSGDTPLHKVCRNGRLVSCLGVAIKSDCARVILILA